MVSGNCEPLREGEGAIHAHLAALAKVFNNILPMKGRRYIIDQEQILNLNARLFSEMFRHLVVERQRGGPVPIVPLFEQEAGDTYWLSFYQEWSVIPRAQRKWNYVTTSLTVFYGSEVTNRFQQLFRAEWAGAAQANPTNPFQAQGAGHPHWQFDVSGSLDDDVRGLINQLARDLGENENNFETEVEELSDFALSEAETAIEMGGFDRLSRMHFPSYAGWFDKAWSGKPAEVEQHAHSPSRLTEVQYWLTSVILYLQQELSR